ncbi:MAG: CarD family transcriptional regulator [Bdellovibrionota bacterium]
MYKVGDQVSYGLHGKCIVTGIETKELSTGPVSFYQIRSIKNPITAKNPNRKDPAILVPVENAEQKGLRAPMTKQEAEMTLKLLAEPDYHFDFNETWVSKQKTLEEVIRKEGAVGLTKVVGHLYVMIKRDAVPPSNVIRFYENVYRIFIRELSESMEVATKDLEPILARALRAKLALDH